MLYTLATNVVAALLRREPQVIAELEKCLARGDVVSLNALGYFETRRGLWETQPKKVQAFERLVQEAGVLELRLSTLDLAATIYQDLRRRGLLIEDADILIAATALAHDATLVTRNLKHFERIEGLKLETWKA